MRIDKLSTPGIKKMHEAIREALAEDDKKPKGQKEYLVRELPDWKVFADDFEAQLKARNQAFNPIIW